MIGSPNGLVVDMTAQRRHVMEVVMAALSVAPLGILIWFRTTGKKLHKTV
jgi:hypothetical protein